MTIIIPTPLNPDKPGIYDYSEIYVPSDPNNTGRYVVAVNSAVWVNNILKKVVAVDSTTFEPTLQASYIDTDDGDTGVSSIVSWGNDILRIYVDNRSLPYRGQIDPSMIIVGGSPSYYTLTRNKGTAKEHLISKYYDSTGKFAKDQVPIVPIDSKPSGYMCDTCNLTEDLNDDEEIVLTVYNEIGAEIRSATIFVKHSSIINDQLDYRPRVSALTIRSPQQLSDGTIFLYEKQDFGSLNIYGEITYDDGTVRTVPVDNVQTYLYGVEDLVAAYSGMLQNITMKYFYGPSETTATTDPTNQSITAYGQVKIIANKEASPTKVSVIPVFNQATQSYNLRYYLYSTSRERVVDCTNYTVAQNGFNGNDYVTTQQFTFSVDMTKVDPSVYQGVATYTQSVCIKLLPPTSYVRYTISDSISSPYLYGADSTNDRRPVLYYDSTKAKYFIPSSIFTSSDSVVKSFYKDANPPYDTRIETAAPTPTHFGVRDPFTGRLLALNDLSNYTKGFSFSVDTDYTNRTVIVEFHIQNSDNDLILFGVPVDIRPGTLVE